MRLEGPLGRVVRGFPSPRQPPGPLPQPDTEQRPGQSPALRRS